MNTTWARQNHEHTAPQDAQLSLPTRRTNSFACVNVSPFSRSELCCAHLVGGAFDFLELRGGLVFATGSVAGSGTWVGSKGGMGAVAVCFGFFPFWLRPSRSQCYPQLPPLRSVEKGTLSLAKRWEWNRGIGWRTSMLVSARLRCSRR